MVYVSNFWPPWICRLAMKSLEVVSESQQYWVGIAPEQMACWTFQPQSCDLQAVCVCRRALIFIGRFGTCSQLVMVLLFLFLDYIEMSMPKGSFSALRVYLAGDCASSLLSHSTRFLWGQKVHSSSLYRQHKIVCSAGFHMAGGGLLLIEY